MFCATLFESSFMPRTVPSSGEKRAENFLEDTVLRRSIKRRSSIHFRFARYFVRIATCYSSICAVFCCYDDDNEDEHCYRDRREFCFDIEEGRFRLLLD